MLITQLDFERFPLKTVILANFIFKIRICFFKFEHYFGKISEMVGPIDVKRTGKASVDY